MGGGVCALGAAPLSSSSSCFFAARHPNQMLLSSPSIKLNRSSNKILVIINIQNNPCASTSTSTFNNKERTGIVVDSIKCQAQSSNSSSTSSSDNNNTVSSPLLYQGAYGPWSVDSSDVTQVILYRTGLVTAAASSVTAASTAFLPDYSSSLLSDIIKNNIDIFYALGAGGLGLSLLLIHIYITEIKRTLQALWAFGILGSFATYFTLAQPAGENLVQYVVHNPSAVWFVGPLFASLTGLVFKEGLCYGKLEAGILTFIIPSLLLGHLSGLMDDGVKVTLLGIWMALFVIFAGRKFTQPIKDDIGDKSVFIFNALPEEQKKALMEKLQQQKFTEET